MASGCPAATYFTGASFAIPENSSPPALALAGVGALGSALLQALAASRTAATLHLVDPDSFQPRNLALAPLLACTAVPFGQPKATLAARALASSTLTSIPHVSEIADLPPAILRTLRLLICAADSTLARAESALLARTFGIPLLDLGITAGPAPSSGRITLYPAAPFAACPLCGLAEDRRAQLLAFAHSPSLSCTLPPQPIPLGETPSALTATRYTAAQALPLLLALLHGRPLPRPFEQTHATTLRLTPVPHGWRSTPHILPLSESCPWHPSPLPAAPFTLLPHIPLAKQIPPGHRLHFAWPLALAAVCAVCGHVTTAVQRLAQLRRTGHCPACAATATLSPVHTLSTLDAGHPLALRTPAELCLPPAALCFLAPCIQLPAPSVPE